MSRRNDPCPCGSRKKYKRCCGGAAGNALWLCSIPSTSKCVNCCARALVMKSRLGYKGYVIRGAVTRITG